MPPKQLPLPLSMKDQTYLEVYEKKVRKKCNIFMKIQHLSKYSFPLQAFNLGIYIYCNPENWFRENYMLPPLHLHVLNDNSYLTSYYQTYWCCCLRKLMNIGCHFSLLLVALKLSDFWHDPGAPFNGTSRKRRNREINHFFSTMCWGIGSTCDFWCHVKFMKMAQQCVKVF